MIFNLSYDLTCPRDKRIMLLYAWFSFIKSHHPAKFGSQRPCRRGAILFFICQVTSCDHIIGGSCDIIGEFSSLLVTILPILVVAGIKKQIFLFSLSRDLTWLHGHRVIWHYRWISLIINDRPAKFVDHRLCGRRDITPSFFTWPHVTTLSEGHVSSWAKLL